MIIRTPRGWSKLKLFHSHLLLFKAIVTVNLTSLLVLTTLFISVSSSLPQTAYVKMVDVWLIFAQVVPWIEVLLHKDC